MSIGDIIKRNVGTIGISSSALALGGATGYFIGRRKSKSKKYKSSSNKKKTFKKKVKRGSNKQYFRKGHQRKGGRTVHYTSTGQPYIKLKNGQARFIKKSKKTKR